MSHRIALLLNFGLKIRHRKFCPIGICEEGAGFVAVQILCCWYYENRYSAMGLTRMSWHIDCNYTTSKSRTFTFYHTH